MTRTADSGLPLAGRRLLVCRGGAAGEADVARIRELGGEAVAAALTVTAPPEDAAALAVAVQRWNRGEYDWLVVTSAKGVSAISDTGAKPVPGSRIAAVGPPTASALRERGFAVDLVPERDFSGVGLAEALTAALAEDPTGAPVRGHRASPRRLLLPLSEIADTTVETALRDAGHEADRVTAYRTVPGPPAPGLAADVAAGRFDAILAMSGSAAREVAERFTPVPPTLLVAAIGRPTVQALEAAGLRADVVAQTHTADGLTDAVAAALADTTSADPADAATLIDPASRITHPADPEGRTA